MSRADPAWVAPVRAARPRAERCRCRCPRSVAAGRTRESAAGPETPPDHGPTTGPDPPHVRTAVGLPRRTTPRRPADAAGGRHGTAGTHADGQNGRAT